MEDLLNLDWEELVQTLTYLIPVIFFVLFRLFFRKQQEQQTRLKVVHSLLSDVKHNQKLAEAFSIQWQTRKFKTGNWKRNKAKMDYIDQSLDASLANAFEIAEEFNRQIDDAKKHRSTSYLASIDVGRLKEPLARSNQGLEEWLQLNKGKEKIFQRKRASKP
ncbi:hypothetical protein ACFLWY_02775 [Chloroflexota bacterium]